MFFHASFPNGINLVGGGGGEGDLTERTTLHVCWLSMHIETPECNTKKIKAK